MQALLAIYLAGAAAGLLFTDATAAGRVTVALLWPVGVLAFAITSAILLLAAAALFPIFGALMATAGGLWLLLS